MPCLWERGLETGEPEALLNQTPMGGFRSLSSALSSHMELRGDPEDRSPQSVSRASVGLGVSSGAPHRPSVAGYQVINVSEFSKYLQHAYKVPKLILNISYEKDLSATVHTDN